MNISVNFNLKNYNTLKLDNIAKYFVNLDKENDIKDILFYFSKFGTSPTFFLGGGSNVLFSKDFEGLIIKNNIQGITQIEDTADYAILEVGGGMKWDEFVRYTLQNNLYGLENLALIPGTVGAAPVQNIGAYGIEQCDCFVELRGYNFANNQFETYSYDDCHFGYRDSIFKNELKNTFIITKVKYKLHKSFEPNLKYKDLQNYIANNTIELTAQNIYNAVCAIRKQKLPDPDIIPNAGSFFKNPIIEKQQFDDLINKFADLKYYVIDNNYYKIPAAYLIEKAGWKGKSIGQAAVYANHSLILINLGNAKSQEILNLADEIIKSIADLFNIRLEFEVNIL